MAGKELQEEIGELLITSVEPTSAAFLSRTFQGSNFNSASHRTVVSLSPDNDVCVAPATTTALIEW